MQKATACTLAVQSSEAAARNLPSGEKARAVTRGQSGDEFAIDISPEEEEVESLSGARAVSWCLSSRAHSTAPPRLRSQIRAEGAEGRSRRLSAAASCLGEVGQKTPSSGPSRATAAALVSAARVAAEEAVADATEGAAAVARKHPLGEKARAPTCKGMKQSLAYQPRRITQMSQGHG